MPETIITEGTTKLYVNTGKIDKKLPVFYNPIMKLNRDISILLLKVAPQERVLDLLSASGARAIRIAKETNCKNIVANDHNKKATTLIKKNATHNNVKISIENKDANEVLATSKGWNYIDIDPFGTPNPFLDQAIQHLGRGGILAVTATDTAALSGTYPKACQRKYFAKPLRNHLMHEVGLRILIRKIQLIGAQYDKALQPILCYSNKHYMRVYLKHTGAKQAVDTILTQHHYLYYNKKEQSTRSTPESHEKNIKKNEQEAGPLYIGALHDEKLLHQMQLQEQEDTPTKQLLQQLHEENSITPAFFYDIHQLCKQHKLSVPKTQALREALQTRGHKSAHTHFTDKGLKTTASSKEIVSALKKLQRKH